MKFGMFDARAAEGLLLAHSQKMPDGVLRKGHVIAPDDVKRFARGGIGQILAARIEEGDVPEDEAAARMAQAIISEHMTLSLAVTGRVNITASVDGLFVADKAAVDRFNRIDKAITFACLADHSRVAAGEMIATLKIVPLAVSSALIEQVAAEFVEMKPIQVLRFSDHSVSLIATQLPSLKVSVMDKTAQILTQRLELRGSHLCRELRVSHQYEAVSSAIKNTLIATDRGPKLLIVFGASAVVDNEDVIPAAIRQAGGEVLAVGMPVDPGNLLVLGRIGDTYILGAPGCARSPKPNGFDWVLDRILAGECPTENDITGMGVGGLLAGTSQRPDLSADYEPC